jgi:curved DNA-binding protein CbpA
MVRGDYYSVLGLSPTASNGEIKKAYRRLVMQYHPDRNPGQPDSDERLRAVNEAYAVLGNPQKRAEYDRSRQGYQRSYWNEDLLRDLDSADLFRDFGLRFDEAARGRVFCRGGRRGCGRRKARILRSIFSENAQSDPWRGVIYDLPLSQTEASMGAQREVVVENGLRRKRYIIRIPPGMGMGTLIRLPLEDEEGSQDVYLKIRLVHG